MAVRPALRRKSRRLAVAGVARLADHFHLSLSVLWISLSMVFNVGLYFFWHDISPSSPYSNGDAALAFFTGESQFQQPTGAISAAAETLTAGDIFFLTYSGHGGQVPDANSDEDDHHVDFVNERGQPRPASRDEKSRLAQLSADQVSATELVTAYGALARAAAGEPQRFDMARREQVRLARFAAFPDRPDRMDHVPRLEPVAFGDLGIAGIAAA